MKRIAAKSKMRTRPTIQCINMNPIKKVTEPNIIKASKIPKNSNPNDAGDDCNDMGEGLREYDTS